MSISTPETRSQQSGRASSANGGQGGDNDLGSFNLRDTLNGIVVREGSFNEFLAALKRFGPQVSRQ
ncbi:MAG: hypothetical protein E6R09_03775 [Rhodocyclaceae bacterium]|nr:MAG: hypothetical protein E6R09_03775 [Rhodocyclaceae bacterium]